MLLIYPLAEQSSLVTILLASLGLIALVVIGLVVVTQVKKRLQGTDQDNVQPGGFTLSDLRSLHKSGQMSDEEFTRAKEQIISAARRAAERDTPQKDTPPGNDLDRP